MSISMGIFYYLITKMYKITCTKFDLIRIPKKGININKKLHHQPIQIEFITQIDKILPCEFKCSISHTTLIFGEVIKANYKLINKSNNYFVSEAIYNITPFMTSKYFNKL